jgi:hypothetical protein
MPPADQKESVARHHGKFVNVVNVFSFKFLFVDPEIYHEAD